MNTISVIFFCCNGKNSHLQPDKVDLIFLKGSSDLDFCGRQRGFSHALIGVYEQAGGKGRKDQNKTLKCQTDIGIFSITCYSLVLS